MSKKILLADDSITIQKVVRITLADGDYELITVDNGDEALKKARQIRPDLVMADVVMPGKDGYQVCQEIKSDPDLNDIPVLLLAGSFEGFDEMKGARLGADGYILKPFESQALVGKVQELLARPRAPKTEAAAAPPPAPAPAAPEPPQVSPPVPTPPAAAAPPPEPVFSPPLEPEPITFGEEPSPTPADDIFSQDFQAAAPASDDLWAQPGEEIPAASIEPESVQPAQPAEQDVWEAMPELEPTVHAEVAGVPEVEAIPEAPTAPGTFGYEPEAVPFAEETLSEAQPVAEPVYGEAFAESIPVEEAPLVPEIEPIPEDASIGEPEVVPTAEMIGQEMPFLEPEVPEAPVVEPFAEPEPFAVEETYTEAEAVAEVEAIEEAEAIAEEEPEAAIEPEIMPEPAAPSPPRAPSAPPVDVKTPIARATEEIATAAAAGLAPDQLKAIIQETIEAVAWEVVPALAEVMIEERLKKWEKEKG